LADGERTELRWRGADERHRGRPVMSPPTGSGGLAGLLPGRVTLKLLLIGALVLVLHVPLVLINGLRQERAGHHGPAVEAVVAGGPGGVAPWAGYRMVERALKHSVLVLTLVFTAFFLFETVLGLRLHAVHYGLVGAALCLFYLALLALGEVWPPGAAYLGASVASSLLIVLYSRAILGGAGRAAAIAALLAVEHSVLYVVLRMEAYALLAGTAALFVALGGVMYFTRRVNWFAEETGGKPTP